MKNNGREEKGKKIKFKDEKGKEYEEEVMEIGENFVVSIIKAV
jgi:hypothetical protein